MASPVVHLRLAFVAALAAAALLTAVQIGVGTRLERNLPFYAAHAIVGKVNGNALQATAFRTPHELPIYGSSELDRWALNRADAFFRLRPGGFAVFPVGRGGSTCLMILQKLAAVGDAARGRRVVIFLSPTWFLRESTDASAVGANLGMIQINTWIFGDQLGPTLKTALARRMQDYRSIFENEPLIAAGIRCLAAPTRAHRLEFELLCPLGRLQEIALRWCDYNDLLQEMVFPRAKWRLKNDYLQNAVPANGAPIDWDRLLAPFGTDEPTRQSISVPAAADAVSGSALDASSQEFGDLKLLLRVLQELSMQALFICQPYNGDDPQGGHVSARTRQAHYARLEEMVRSAGFAWRDFADHGEDPAFYDDPLHPSAKAWLFYDREIDRFYRESGQAAKQPVVPIR